MDATPERLRCAIYAPEEDSVFKELQTMRPASPTSHLVRPIHEKLSMAKREWRFRKCY